MPHGLLTSSLAMVDQDIDLIEGTVTENLTLWDTTVPETRLVQAAKDASIHDDIAARPGGYESKVDEAGGNFSGGPAPAPGDSPGARRRPGADGLRRGHQRAGPRRRRAS